MRTIGLGLAAILQCCASQALPHVPGPLSRDVDRQEIEVRVTTPPDKSISGLAPHTDMPVEGARVFVIGTTGCLLAEATTDRTGLARLGWTSPVMATYILGEATGFFLAGERARTGEGRYELVAQVYYTVERILSRPTYPTTFVREAMPPEPVSGGRVFVLDTRGCEIGVAWTDRQGTAEIRNVVAGTPHYVLADAAGFLLSGDHWRGTAYYDLPLIRSPGHGPQSVGDSR